jgi:hypothetical protein
MNFINYISDEPTNENDHKTGFKFPFNASEILASENVFIIDKFFEEEEESNSRKGSDREKEESKFAGRSSSIIEINMSDDMNNNNNNENEKKSLGEFEAETNANNSKDKNMLKFLEFDEKEQVNKEHIENQTKVDIVPENNNKGENVDSSFNPEIIKTEESKASKESVEKKKNYYNLDYFFRFLNNKGPLNYVLCGYFYKVFNHLSNYKNSYVSKL